MKHWALFVIMTILCWGAYVPTIHQGQQALGGRNTALRAFLFVGLAYFLLSAFVLAYIRWTRAEPMQFTAHGATVSTFAGLLGALGALGIVFAIKNGGSPLYVAPLVFAGAPIVNTFVSMLLKRPAQAPSLWFYVGLALAACGAGLVLRFKPT